MKLFEMKCNNCGSILEVEEGTKNVTCKYCHTVFAIDDETQHIQYDNMFENGYEFEKGRMKAQSDLDTPYKNETEEFNDQFEKYKGTQYKMSIEYLLDNIVTNNKKNDDHKIIVEYKEKQTIEPDQIIKIKHILKDKKHEVVLDYDENDCVNKVSIIEIKMKLSKKIALFVFLSIYLSIIALIIFKILIPSFAFIQ